jgi:hypothetical protein
MASYNIPQVDHNLYAPILPESPMAEIASMITQKQQMYNTGLQQTSRKIQQMSDLESSLTSEVAKNKVSKYNDEVSKKLDSYKNLDFSIQDNINLVDNLYTPLTKDKDFLVDYAYSNNLASNIKKADQFRTSLKKEERDAYNQTNVQFLLNGRDAVKSAKSTDELQSAVSRYGDRTYIPYVNYQENIQKKIKDSGFNVVQDTLLGNYIVKGQDGNLVADSLSQFARFNLSDQEINQMRIESTVALEDASKTFGETGAALKFLELSKSSFDEDLANIKSEDAFNSARLLALNPNDADYAQQKLKLEQFKNHYKASIEQLNYTLKTYNELMASDLTDPNNQRILYNFAESEAPRMVMDSFVEGIANANANIKRKQELSADPFNLANYNNNLKIQAEKLKEEIEAKKILDAETTAKTPEGYVTGEDYGNKSDLFGYRGYEDAVLNLNEERKQNKNTIYNEFFRDVGFAFSGDKGLGEFLSDIEDYDTETKNLSIESAAKKGNEYSKYIVENYDSIKKSLSKYGLTFEYNNVKLSDLTIEDFKKQIEYNFEILKQEFYNKDGNVNSELFTPDIVSALGKYNENNLIIASKQKNIEDVKKDVLSKIHTATEVIEKAGSGDNVWLLTDNLRKPLNEWLTPEGTINYKLIDSEFDKHFYSEKSTPERDTLLKDKKKKFARAIINEYDNWFNKTVDVDKYNTIIDTPIIEFKNDQNSNKKNAQLMYNENLRPLVSRLITTIQYGENADGENNSPRIILSKEANDYKDEILKLMTYSGNDQRINTVTVYDEDRVRLKYNLYDEMATTTKDEKSTNKQSSIFEEISKDMDKKSDEYDRLKKAVDYLSTEGVIVGNAGMDENKFGTHDITKHMIQNQGFNDVPLGNNTKNFSVVVTKKGNSKSDKPYDIIRNQVEFEEDADKYLVISDDGTIALSNDGKPVMKTWQSSTSNLEQALDRSVSESVKNSLDLQRNLYNFAQSKKGKEIVAREKAKGRNLTLIDLTTLYINSLN